MPGSTGCIADLLVARPVAAGSPLLVYCHLSCAGGAADVVATTHRLPTATVPPDVRNVPPDVRNVGSSIGWTLKLLLLPVPPGDGLLPAILPLLSHHQLGCDSFCLCY